MSKIADGLAGATIIVTYTSKDATDAVKPISEKYGVPIHVYRCPGEESKVVDEVVEKASKEVGEIDIVVVNAGTSFPASKSRELMNRCLDVERPYRLYRRYAPSDRVLADLQRT